MPEGTVAYMYVCILIKREREREREVRLDIPLNLIWKDIPGQEHGHARRAAHLAWGLHRFSEWGRRGDICVGSGSENLWRCQVPNVMDNRVALLLLMSYSGSR